MNCPHCGYEHRTFNNDTSEYEYNEEYGGFFKLPLEATRNHPYLRSNMEVYGCPKCGIMFMEV